MDQTRLGARMPGLAGEIYEIEGFIGSGAFGEVYRVREQSSGKVLAVKVLPTESSHDTNIETTLLNEIRTATEIRHPNVVEVYHGGSTVEVGPYMLMEYLPDGNLNNLIKTQRAEKVHFSIPRSLEMMTDVARGMQAVNEKLIHRDLKPDNILLQANRLKIADFGLSKFVDQRTRTHTFKGIQHVFYMSPEVWENQRNSVMIDVYSAGLIFVEILLLEHPLWSFVSDVTNTNEWRKAHLFEKVPDLPRKETTFRRVFLSWWAEW
jgi:serine/threonine protein kinase